MGLGLHSAIHIAHMGMGAAEKSINVSGTNLANANTYGYKAERADFVSFLSYTYNYGYPSSDTNAQSRSAGSNPLQIGMGVELGSVTTDFTQGAFKEGMTNSDLAINGEGFLVVKNPGSDTLYYTRNGALKLNDDLYLTTNQGMYVQGYSSNGEFEIQDGTLGNIRIPIGEMHIAEQTSLVSIAGILDAVGDSGTQGTVLRTKQMTDMSRSWPEDEKATASQLERPGNVEGIVEASGATTPGGEVAEGDYLYRFVYVDGNNVESDYSGSIQATVGAGENSVSLTHLPGVPDQYASLRIYRADESGTAYHRVADIDPSASSYTFVDTFSDASIASNPELNQSRLGTSNYSYQYYVTYFDELGNESRPSLISDPISLNSGEGGQGGQVRLSDIPTIEGENPDNWTGRRIYRNSGDDPTSFYLVDEIKNMDAGMTVIDRVSDVALKENLEMSLAGRKDVLINENTRLLDVGKFENGKFVQTFESEGTLTLTPKKGKEELKVATLEIKEDTTVGDYLRFLDDAYGIRNGDGIPRDRGAIGQTLGGGLQKASVQDGVLYLLGNSGTDNELALDSADMRFTPTPKEGATESKTTTIDMGWQTTDQNAIGSSVSTDLEVYDSLGTPINVRMTMVLESKSNDQTVYRWYADSPDNQPDVGGAIATGTGTFTFDSHGKLLDTDGTRVSVRRTGVASVDPLDFEFNMNVDALMALATGTPNLSQTYNDGAAAGTLMDFEIQPDGVITGIFSGGATRAIGQLPLATFKNQEGLYKSGDSLFQESVNSGQANIGVAGTVGRGTIKGRSLELSNSDIGQEIVDMILSSSMYRANAKVMTTSNEMYDALLRII